MVTRIMSAIRSGGSFCTASAARFSRHSLFPMGVPTGTSPRAGVRASSSATRRAQFSDKRWPQPNAL